MTKIITIILFLGVCFVYTCAPMPEVQPKQKSNLTVGMVKTKIVKGETNQAEVMALFGAPNLVTINKNDNEVWNYSKMSFESGAAAASDIWLGSRALATSTTSSFDLILIFDDNDVVLDYSIISSSY
jgi:hypothetical protein